MKRCRLLRVHAGGRLVEQEQLGLCGERTGNFQSSLVTVREVAGIVVFDTIERAVREQLDGTRTGVPLLTPDARRPEDAADDAALDPAVHANENVLEGRHLLKQANVLEGAADTALGHVMRRPPRDVLAGELDDARGRLVDAREHVEERRLACAVRPDQRDDRALRNREVDVVHGGEPTELLAQCSRREKASAAIYSSGPPRTSISG